MVELLLRFYNSMPFIVSGSAALRSDFKGCGMFTDTPILEFKIELALIVADAVICSCLVSFSPAA